MTLTDEQQQLAEDNIGFAYYMANKLRGSTPFEYDDLTGFCMEGLCRAAVFFDPEKGYKFATIASVVIKHWVLNKARDYNLHNVNASYLEDLFNSDTALHWETILSADQRPIDEMTLTSVEIQNAFKTAKFTPREKQLMSIVIAEPRLKQREIAQIMGINQVLVSRTLNRIRKKLQDKIAV